MKWDLRKNSNGSKEYSAKGPAGKAVMGNAFNVIIGKSINGSGADEFGGSKNWPTVRMEIPFLEGEDKKARKFAKDFKKFLKNWLLENKGE